MSKEELSDVEGSTTNPKEPATDEINSVDKLGELVPMTQILPFKTTTFWKPEEPKPKLPCEILTPNDSRDPSYTNLTLPYRVICHQRYQKCARQYRKQFINEIKRQEAMQFRALDGIRIRREFCDPLIEPLPPEDRIKLTPKQKFRLDELMRS